jgi:hypothetical protein
LLAIAGGSPSDRDASDDAFHALCGVDDPRATAVLKKHVEDSWPMSVELENYAGLSRRSTPLAEVARRDPHWLAELALREMGSRSLPARECGAQVFRRLTGYLGSYRAEAFASERVEPLQALQHWWDERKGRSREAWLLEYFRGKGFAMGRLDKEALPVLGRALGSDFFTYNLAVEQISAVCQKFFVEFKEQESYQEQERMTVRIRGWLRARGFISGGN